MRCRATAVGAPLAGRGGFLVSAGVRSEMLFNSPEFLFIFLPVVVAGFYLLRAWRFSAAFYWLLALSLIFYGWNQPWFLVVIGISITANYLFGLVIAGSRHPRRRWGIAGLAIASNLLLLGYYKYT